MIIIIYIKVELSEFLWQKTQIVLYVSCALIVVGFFTLGRHGQADLSVQLAP